VHDDDANGTPVEKAMKSCFGGVTLWRRSFELVRYGRLRHMSAPLREIVDFGGSSVTTTRAAKLDS
jgi:hypothetical protein